MRSLRLSGALVGTVSLREEEREACRDCKWAAKGRQRGGRPGRKLENRNRQQLYEIAKSKNIPGRSKMGKWDLIEAIRRAS